MPTSKPVVTSRDFRLYQRYKHHQWVAHTRWMSASAGYQIAKRALDIVGASTLILLSAPVTIAIALAIKAYDRGPVVYWQRRVGQYCGVLPFPKFRSMRLDADKLREELLTKNQHGQSITFKMKNDPRVTPVGRVLRRLSLDELPQLWCVLVGTMSLVGPRPP